MCLRKAHITAHGRIPGVSNGREPCVERCTQLLNKARQRIAEVAVLALAEAVAGHDDMTSEPCLGIDVVQPYQLEALVCSEHSADHGPTVASQVRGHIVPVSSGKGFAHQLHAVSNTQRGYGVAPAPMRFQ